jgi:hypothetical protein
MAFAGTTMTREVEVEYADGRIAEAPVRFVAVYSTEASSPLNMSWN